MGHHDGGALLIQDVFFLECAAHDGRRRWILGTSFGIHRDGRRRAHVGSHWRYFQTPHRAETSWAILIDRTHSSLHQIPPLGRGYRHDETFVLSSIDHIELRAFRRGGRCGAHSIFIFWLLPELQLIFCDRLGQFAPFHQHTFSSTQVRELGCTWRSWRHARGHEIEEWREFSSTHRIFGPNFKLVECHRC